MSYAKDWMPKVMPVLMLTGALLALTACEPSGPSAPLIERPSPSLLEVCQGPVALPERDAEQAEVERWWRADRARLVECASRHNGLAEWAEQISEATAD